MLQRDSNSELQEGVVPTPAPTLGCRPPDVLQEERAQAQPAAAWAGLPVPTQQGPQGLGEPGTSYASSK